MVTIPHPKQIVIFDQLNVGIENLDFENCLGFGDRGL